MKRITPAASLCAALVLAACATGPRPDARLIGVWNVSDVPAGTYAARAFGADGVGEIRAPAWSMPFQWDTEGATLNTAACAFNQRIIAAEAYTFTDSGTVIIERIGGRPATSYPDSAEWRRTSAAAPDVRPYDCN